jgi:hypothetical protein
MQALSNALVHCAAAEPAVAGLAFIQTIKKQTWTSAPQLTSAWPGKRSICEKLTNSTLIDYNRCFESN